MVERATLAPLTGSFFLLNVGIERGSIMAAGMVQGPSSKGFAICPPVGLHLILDAGFVGADLTGGGKG